MSNSRNIALNVLLKIEQDDAYSNIALNNAIKENKLNQLDASFVSALVYGVLEHQITLDYILRQYSKIPIRKIEIKTKIILRLGILQLLFMDKVPESAAVNESVNLAKKHKLQKSSGFINGVLRS
ncbi:MAG TPA: 16S rRNA (cytosine(967)-C(5))-methyltransferase RsmB, partial [Ruminococcus sp.]|nr:16S rRNA (cytosine(967)-C(5))-methyltransferase RsmB [Ruminococcus sp.]